MTVEIVQLKSGANEYTARVLTEPEPGDEALSRAVLAAHEEVMDAARRRGDTCERLRFTGMRADKHHRWAIYAIGVGCAPVREGPCRG